MHSSDEAGPRWFKSSRSSGAGNCVEVALNVDGHGGVGVRHSKNPTGPVTVFTPEEWTAFIDGAKDGEFDI